MNYFVLIIFISLLFSTVNCLQCYSNSTTNSAGIEVIECEDDYCIVIGLLSGSGDTLRYVELEGCGTVLKTEPILKSFNLTCENGTQSGNTTFDNTPYYGLLYCCTEDKCNSQIPGFTPPPIPSTTTTITTTTTTTLPPSTTTTSTTNPSSTTSNGGITLEPILSTMLFISVTLIIFK